MKNKIYFAFFFLLSLTACQDGEQTISLGLRDTYILARMQKEGLFPAFTGEAYEWTMLLPDGRDSLVSTERNYIFLQSKPGTYRMRFRIIDPIHYVNETIKFVVIDEQVEYSSYISRVYEYMPAPGQFVNGMPVYEEGDTAETMRQKAEKSLTSNSLISLGGYGGYVTFGFDHTVVNVDGQRDFEIYGNSFYSTIGGGKNGGSNEPGIVMVSFDRNMNGIPDDEWYELAGSEYYKQETIKGYELTYYKPDPDKEPVPDPDDETATDATYIRWESNQNDFGYVKKNIYHDQSYWPQWIDSNTLTFSGTKLADNYYTVTGGTTLYVQVAYDWGYADNHPNEAEDVNNNKLCSFDIGWAVDKKGNKVYLPGVDFIRVYTGVNQYCGWLGETSTEIAGAKDLHVSRMPQI